MRRWAALLLALAAQMVATAEGPELTTVMAAWNQTAQGLKHLPPYLLTGQVTNYVFTDGKPGITATYRWHTIVDGSRYRLSWTKGRGPVREQAFDGKNWYLFTNANKVNSGAIVTAKQNNLDENPEDFLRKVSDGVFFPRLEDFADHPMNFAAKSLLSAYGTEGKGVSVSSQDDVVILSLSPTLAIDRNLPDVLDLRFLGSGLYPSSCLLKPRSNDYSQTVTFSGYTPFGGCYYPKRVLTEIRRLSTADHPVYFESDMRLTVEPTKVTDADFKLSYPSNTKLDDARKPVTEVPIESAHPGGGWGREAAIAAGGTALLGIFLFTLRRSRNRTKP